MMRLIVSCKEASRLVSQSLDRQLAWRERLVLRMHLAVCKYCRLFSQQLQTLKLTAQSLVRQTEKDLSITLSAKAKIRIAKEIKDRL